MSKSNTFENDFLKHIFNNDAIGSIGDAWGDAWGPLTANPNALRGSAHGQASAVATLSAIAWIAGSAEGSSSVHAHLELNESPPVLVAVDFGNFRPRRARRQRQGIPASTLHRRRQEAELMLLGAL